MSHNEWAGPPALTNLITSADGGGYSLPAELLKAWEVMERVKGLTAPAAPDAFDVDRAAAQLLGNVATGPVADDHLLDLAREVDQATTKQAASNRAAQIKHGAVNLAVAQAVTIGARLTNVIIAEHLRPAWDALHGEARDVANTLTGVDLQDAAGLIKAPAKVRNAYLQLPGLVPGGVQSTTPNGGLMRLAVAHRNTTRGACC